ncbi:glycosidase [Alicycliphilus sp. B1]|nr:glycosidase [Alicycliphilus sp. B1]
MNASALPASTSDAIAATAVPSPSFSALASQPASTPLTRVALAYVDQRIDIYLRFGEPAHVVRYDRWRRCAVFLPNAMFCRIRWQSNDFGTVRWQLMVMQACTPLDGAQRIPGVQPGARLLLHAEGDKSVRAVLQRIDAIEALGIAPIGVSPAYWRTLGNRLAARSPLPEYSAERHAAWLTGRALP